MGKDCICDIHSGGMFSSPIRITHESCPVHGTFSSREVVWDRDEEMDRLQARLKAAQAGLDRYRAALLRIRDEPHDSDPCFSFDIAQAALAVPEEAEAMEREDH